MDVKKRISILIIITVIFTSIISISLFSFLYKSEIFSFELILFINIALCLLCSCITSKYIYGIIREKYFYKENIFKDCNLDSLVSNIPGGMVNLSYSNYRWNVDFVSLWCYEVLGYDKEVDKDSIIETVYEKDRVLIFDILKDILLGSEYGEVEIRVKNSSSELVWVKVKINGIYDSSGELSKVVAIVIDIDDVKKENERLYLKSQIDSLTEVLNKEGIIRNIEEYIEHDNSLGAFIIIDIDNFKLFNDLLGHIYGDEVLVMVAENLKKVFGDNSYIGRIGGDEFCVFMRKTISEEVIIENVSTFLELIRKIKIGSDKKLSVLVSIGIAKYPEHGESFRELYINSDKALYNTKNNGKNGYSVFK